jgi:hypothetical protein
MFSLCYKSLSQIHTIFGELKHLANTHQSTVVAFILNWRSPVFNSYDYVTVFIYVEQVNYLCLEIILP